MYNIGSASSAKLDFDVIEDAHLCIIYLGLGFPGPHSFHQLWGCRSPSSSDAWDHRIDGTVNCIRVIRTSISFQKSL